MSIKFSLSSKQDSDGRSELLMRIVIGRNHVYRIKTGIRIPKKTWNTKTNKVVIPRLHTEEQTAMLQLQMQIDHLSHSLTELLCSTPSDEIDKPTIENTVKAVNMQYIRTTTKTTENTPFKNGFESFIKLQVKTRKRAELYRCLWKQMMRFETYMNGTFVWNFDITADDIQDFEHFLLEEASFLNENGEPKKEYEYIYKGIEMPKRIKRGKNAVSGIIKKLRIFFNWAEKTQLFTGRNPFLTYNAHQCVYGTPYFMTKEEIDVLYKTDFSVNKQLEFHKDLFVFQSNVGMRVGDLFSLTKCNIINDATLEYIPSKTIHQSGKNVSVPLTKVAIAIITKYHDENRDELFPFINVNYYNEDIKKVLKLAGIERIITVYDPLTSTNVQRPICEVASSHMARRNFIGNLYNKVADPNIIGSMTGHVDGSKAFARYRTIGEDLKKKALSALE